MGGSKAVDREAEALAEEEAEAGKLSRDLFDAAVNNRIISRVRPSCLKELAPSKTLTRSEYRDIHKKSSQRRNRYMMVMPGQIAGLKEGRLGSIGKLDTQSPVVYLEFPNGRIKLQGTIVRCKTSKYFSLNIKARDKMQLEDWFENVIVFSRWYWVGTALENPTEKPLPMPEELAEVAGAAPPVDFTQSVAAEDGSKPASAAGQVGDPLEIDEDEDEDEDEEGGDPGRKEAEMPSSRRPQRAAATNNKSYALDDDDDDLEGSDEDEEDEGKARIAVQSKGSAAPPPPSSGFALNIPCSEKTSAKGSKASAGKPARGSASGKKAAATKPAVVTIDDDSDDDDVPLGDRLGAGGGSKLMERGQSCLDAFLARGGKAAAAGKTPGKRAQTATEAAPPAKKAATPAARGASSGRASAQKAQKYVEDEEEEEDDEDEDEEDEDSDFEA